MKRLEISKGREECLIFSFPSEFSRDRILRQGPSNIKGSLLVLKKWDVEAILQEISFSDIQLWMQIHGLPLGLMTRDRAIEYGAKAGLIQEVDFDKDKKVWGMTFL